MHDRVRIRFTHTGHLSVAVEQRLKSYLLVHTFEREPPFLTKLLCRGAGLAIEPEYFEIFDFIEHRHFGLASPAPKPLHGVLMIAQ